MTRPRARIAAWLPLALLGAAICLQDVDAHAACSNAIASETFSPGGLLRAVLFIRDCGEGNRSAHLSVLPLGAALPDAPGNTFIAESLLGAGEDARSLRVDVSWLSDAELSVLQGALRRVKHAERVGGIRVFYGHLMDPPPPRWPQ
jgi:hypothetical protein